MQSAKPSTIKEHNRKLICDALYQGGMATPTALSRATGLSVVTVHSLLSDLMDSQVIRDAGLLPSSGGRPSQSYMYRYEHKSIAAISILVHTGRTVVVTAVANLRAEIQYRKTDLYEDFQETTLRQLLQKLCAQHDNLCYVAVGAAGRRNGNTLYMTELPFLSTPGLFSALTEEFQVPVRFHNACSSAVLGTCKRLSMSSADPVMGVNFPVTEDPSAGLVWNDYPTLGHHGFAGEISSLNPDWSSIDYSDANSICAALEVFLAICCCMLAPKQIILYGSFWTDEILERLRDYCCQILYFQFEPHFIACDTFDEDCIYGLLHLSLRTLGYPPLPLS